MAQPMTDHLERLADGIGIMIMIVAGLIVIALVIVLLGYAYENAAEVLGMVIVTVAFFVVSYLAGYLKTDFGDDLERWREQ